MLEHPILLTPDNFTPPSRTPWGGCRIADHYKAEVENIAPGTRVGESWEISVEPDFPSRVAGSGKLLTQVLEADPTRALGQEARAGRASTALLVKLLDAADNLSLQIHPTDDDPSLGPDEAGKPESWYVLERQAGSGLYIGLKNGVDRKALEAAIQAGGDVSAMLAFVPVNPGDFFVIEACTPHAIGSGVTLVEPQHVCPGKRGVTYRYWDWNRRYDGQGRPDPTGQPRALHLHRALEVTAWSAPREDALLGRCRLVSGWPELDGPACLTPLCGPDGGLGNTFLNILRLSGTGRVTLAPTDVLRGLTVVAGTVELRGKGFSVLVPKGRSAVLPACLGPTDAILSGGHGLLSSVVPP